MDEKHKQEALEWCRKQLARSKANIELIDKGRLKIQRGDGPGNSFRDVTAEHRAWDEDIVSRMEKLIAAYEAGDA